MLTRLVKVMTCNMTNTDKENEQRRRDEKMRKRRQRRRGGEWKEEEGRIKEDRKRGKNTMQI